MIMANDNNIQPMADDSQIVLYQPDESISLHVKIDRVSSLSYKKTHRISPV